METLKDSYKIKADKYKIIEMVKKNLAPLKENPDLFKYDEKYKRFNLSFDVRFKKARFRINKQDLKDSDDIQKLKRVGKSLEKLIKDLNLQKKENDKLKDVSYLIVISGSASKDKASDETNYKLSHKRAYHLYKFWQRKGIDLDKEEYHDLVDFHIAGNGTGGVGRFKLDETKNQRFIINIIPKIGEIK